MSRFAVVMARVILAAGLAVSSVLQAQSPPPTGTPLPPEVAAQVERLESVPVLYNVDTEQVHEIFARGQASGNNARIFTTVGDSNTTSGDFLRPIGVGKQVCDLGDYAYLQETIDFFSISPLPGLRNSFDRQSYAAINGLSTAAALNPTWADSDVCGGQSPLVCEYNLVKPSISVIMLGLMDLDYFDVETYSRYLERIVQVSIDQGVIPTLTTFTVLPDYPDPNNPLWEKAMGFNVAMLDIADAYGIPVIHLWSALQPLPDYGIGPDLTHLKHVVGKFCDFTGAEREIGGTLRNLLTLQMLDELRSRVLTTSQ